MKTIRVISDVRPDLGYAIINEADFNPEIQTLWSEQPPTPVEQPPAQQPPKAEQPKRSKPETKPEQKEESNTP